MEEIAQVYSRALFEAAQQDGKLDELREQLGALCDALADSQDLQVLLLSPYLSPAEKRASLRRVIDGAGEMLLNFLDLLIDNARMPLIHRIRRQYEALWEEAHRRLPVQVTSAVELDEETVRAVGERIGERTGRQVELTSSVDPEILGGIVLRVGNSILDASIKNRLDHLRRQVARA